MGLSPDTLQPLMMIAGVGLMCWLLLRGRMQSRRTAVLPVRAELGHNTNVRQAKSAHRRKNQFDGTQSLGAPSEVLKWQVELHDLGRELKAELDCKLVAVRTMTTTYDHAARRLAEMIRLAEQVQLSPTSPLAEARRLSSLGWDAAKIAAMLGISAPDVEQLLKLQ